jgi:peptidoglycan hydrolase-like protein with peptidoglycan-binding domain
MKTWTITGVLLVTGAMLAGPAAAQTTPATTEQKDKAAGGAATEPGAGKTAARREHVKAVQQALKDKGHDPGAVDGVLGPKTQAALKDFQSKEGLKASGRLDAETMSKLGVPAKAGAAADTGGSRPSASPRTGGSTTTK